MNIYSKFSSVIFQFILFLAQVVFIKQNQTWVIFTWYYRLCCTMSIFIKFLLKKINVYVFNVQTLKSVPIAALEKYLIWS